MTLDAITFYIAILIVCTNRFTGCNINGEQTDALPSRCGSRGSRIECGYERENTRRFSGIRRPPVYDIRSAQPEEITQNVTNAGTKKNIDDDDGKDKLNMEEEKRVVKIMRPKVRKVSSCMKLMKRILGDLNKELPLC